MDEQFKQREHMKKQMSRTTMLPISAYLKKRKELMASLPSLTFYKPTQASQGGLKTDERTV